MLPIISIIIPTYNEASLIQATLQKCLNVPGTETIVADGGSDDGTGHLATESGAQVVSSSRGKGRQMNLAALKSRGDILLFLHADTHLPKGFPQPIVSALKDPAVSGGAFRLRIRGDNLALRLVERGANFRARVLELPYGDQAIFMRRKTFHKINGFRELPIMEDLDLVWRLRKLGSIVILSEPVLTSARRWKRLGCLKTTLINQIAVAAYLAGLSPERIAAFYKRGRLLP